MFLSSHNDVSPMELLEEDFGHLIQIAIDTVI